MSLILLHRLKMMCDTKKHLLVNPSPKTASLADRNREGVKTSLADLDPLVQTAAEILGRELQERLFDLPPRTCDALSSACRDKATSCHRKAACSPPSKSKSSFARRRTCRPSGLLNRRDSVRRSLRFARLHAKHWHHTNAAEGSSSRDEETEQAEEITPMWSC
jgi:hypothetical protein